MLVYRPKYTFRRMSFRAATQYFQLTEGNVWVGVVTGLLIPNQLTPRTTYTMLVSLYHCFPPFIYFSHFIVYLIFTLI